MGCVSEKKEDPECQEGGCSRACFGIQSMTFSLENRVAVQHTSRTRRQQSWISITQALSGMCRLWPEKKSTFHLKAAGLFLNQRQHGEHTLPTISAVCDRHCCSANTQEPGVLAVVYRLSSANRVSQMNFFVVVIVKDAAARRVYRGKYGCYVKATWDFIKT